ncbi:MAG: APC family permease [Quadrisphaera sp.]
MASEVSAGAQASGSTSQGKGLATGTLGLWGNTVIGLASTAPAYGLAATLGYLGVGEKAPAMFIVAFIPMVLTAIAYQQLNRAVPDCGTTFTWATKAFGPVVGWMGGWGVAVSAIIVLANVAEIAAIYTLRVVGLDGLADSQWGRMAFAVAFIAVMTYVSYRGILLSERMQNVLVAWQFLFLVVLAAWALVAVYSGSAGPQAVRPEVGWFIPTGIGFSDAVAAIVLCIFLYWGWDACLAVNEESKDPDRIPGRAATLATIILVVTFTAVATAIQAYSGFGTTGIGLNNPENADDTITVLGDPLGGPVLAVLLMITIAVSAAASTQSTILPTARGTLAMAVYKALPPQFGTVHPRFKTPSFSTTVMGVTAVGFYVVLSLISTNALADSIASLGLAVAFYYGITSFACVWFFRATLRQSAANLWLRGVLPFLGGVFMLVIFGYSVIDMARRDYGETVIGGVGGVFVLGVGMLALGVPLMLLCAIRLRAFFRGETLNARTEVLVPDTGAPPVAGL